MKILAPTYQKVVDDVMADRENEIYVQMKGEGANGEGHDQYAPYQPSADVFRQLDAQFVNPV